MSDPYLKHLVECARAGIGRYRDTLDDPEWFDRLPPNARYTYAHNNGFVTDDEFEASKSNYGDLWYYVGD